MLAGNAKYERASDLPATVPVFPLSGALLLPRVHMPLNIFEPRYLAMIDSALGGAGRSQEALDHLFELMKREREWNDGAAQKQLLTFFEVWGPKDPATIAGRRRLSLLLFS